MDGELNFFEYIFYGLLYALAIATLFALYKLIGGVIQRWVKKVDDKLERKIDRLFFKKDKSATRRKDAIAEKQKQQQQQELKQKLQQICLRERQQKWQQPSVDIELNMSEYRGKTAQDDRAIVLRERKRLRMTESSAYLCTWIFCGPDGAVKPRSGVVGTEARVYKINPGEESLQDLIDNNDMYMR